LSPNGRFSLGARDVDKLASKVIAGSSDLRREKPQSKQCETTGKGPTTKTGANRNNSLTLRRSQKPCWGGLAVLSGCAFRSQHLQDSAWQAEREFRKLRTSPCSRQHFPGSMENRYKSKINNTLPAVSLQTRSTGLVTKRPRWYSGESRFWVDLVGGC